jgi:hypothetical protein
MHEKVCREKDDKGVKSYGKNESMEDEQGKKMYPNLQNIIQRKS